MMLQKNNQGAVSPFSKPVPSASVSTIQSLRPVSNSTNDKMLEAASAIPKIPWEKRYHAQGQSSSTHPEHQRCRCFLADSFSHTSKERGQLRANPITGLAPKTSFPLCFLCLSSPSCASSLPYRYYRWPCGPSQKQDAESPRDTPRQGRGPPSSPFSARRSPRRSGRACRRAQAYKNLPSAAGGCMSSHPRRYGT